MLGLRKRTGREHARLSHAQEEASCEKAAVILDETLTECHEAEEKHAHGYCERCELL